MLWFVMWLRTSSLPFTHYICHHGQWFNEVEVVGPLFPPASRGDTSASQLLVSSKSLQRHEVYNPVWIVLLLYFFSRIQL
ncbi:UNVERIFIED_CONTAM: hypothetical protein NCL1_27106 [Trichonephila clavipes]